MNITRFLLAPIAACAVLFAGGCSAKSGGAKTYD
jgi:hypothetical protein